MNNKEVNIFMAGRFVRTDQPLNVINPFDQSSFATTFLASKKSWKQP